MQGTGKALFPGNSFFGNEVSQFGLKRVKPFKEPKEMSIAQK